MDDTIVLEEIKEIKKQIALERNPLRLEELQKNLILTYEYYVFLVNTKKAAA